MKRIFGALFLTLAIATFAWGSNESSYHIPLFADSADDGTGIGLSNLNTEEAADVTVSIYGRNGEKLATESKTIPAGGQDAFVAGEGLKAEGSMVVESSQPLGGLCFIGRMKGAYMADVPFAATLSTDLVLPHVAVTSAWDTQLYLNNPNAAETTVTLTFSRPDGSTPYGDFSATLPAFGSSAIDLSEVVGGNTEGKGRVDISSTSGIAAFAIYHNLKTTQYSYSGIHAIDKSSTAGDIGAAKYYIPLFMAGAEDGTGIGLSNLNAEQAATVTVSIYGGDGEKLATETKTIPAGGQDAFVAGAGLNAEGSMVVSSSQPLGGLCFIARMGGKCMADVPFSGSLFNEMVLPHVASNSGWNTRLYFSNPNTIETTILLSFARPDGSRPYSDYSLTLPANGSSSVDLSEVVGGNSEGKGRVDISSTSGITAFAIYHNLTAGLYSYSGVYAVAKDANMGWTGEPVVADDVFLDPSKWTANQADSTMGDQIAITSQGSDLQLRWSLGTGNRAKWVQSYMVLDAPLSLEDADIFGLDLKGSQIEVEPEICNVGFELKFEDGSTHAMMRWDGIKDANRWYEKISALKKQFINTDLIDWSKITVISFAVYSYSNNDEDNCGNISSGSGVLNLKNLVKSRTADWSKAKCRKKVDPDDEIKEGAISAIIGRQAGTGLLTTWTEDDSSWLYGQGLALKALSLEGVWDGTLPVNDEAKTAEKLALFLAENQIEHSRGGYWPRTWKTSTGEVIKEAEDDGTIWMGDQPWPLIGLQCYYKKTGETRVAPAIGNALQFIKSLVKDDGNLVTIDVDTDEEVAVTSCEAYAAVLQSLHESNETQLAEKLWDRLYAMGWDNDLNYWKETDSSYRPVLFANSWLSTFLVEKGLSQDALDSLSFIGKALYTCGPGVPCGLDGFGPVAVWYEGTLSYISAGGPGSIELFDNLKNYIHPDGTVSHYNDTSTVAGIWAVEWHSLDGTSWLYFASSGNSPFVACDGTPYQP